MLCHTNIYTLSPKVHQHRKADQYFHTFPMIRVHRFLYRVIVNILILKLFYKIIAPTIE
jgi:hypothetical protein